VDSLSGEMQQEARTRALSSFRRGENARGSSPRTWPARGIDVQDVHARVAGRTTDRSRYLHAPQRPHGPCGRKGTSALLVAPTHVQAHAVALSRARRAATRSSPYPAADRNSRGRRRTHFHRAWQRARRRRPRAIQKQVEKLVAAGFAERALAHLLARVRTGRCQNRRDVDPDFSGAGAAARRRATPRAQVRRWTEPLRCLPGRRSARASSTERSARARERG
jgi:hypothetical protein